jgi:hypothetical protein
MVDAIDDDGQRGEVAWPRSDFALRMADFRAMESWARKAMAFAERAERKTARTLHFERQNGLVNVIVDEPQRIANTIPSIGE